MGHDTQESAQHQVRDRERFTSISKLFEPSAIIAMIRSVLAMRVTKTLTSRSFIHDLFEGGAVVQVHSGTEAPAFESGKLDPLFLVRLRTVEFNSQGDNDQFVQGNTPV
jgi:hypothetical protein